MQKTKVCVWLDPDLYVYLDENRGEELTIPQYIRLILKQKAKTKKKSKSQKQNTDPFASPNITSEMIPDDLKGYADLITEWWAIRYINKATCSTSVAKRIFNKLSTFSPTAASKALERAIAGGWKDIYEIKESKFTEEPKNHPNQKVFKASDVDLPPTLAELNENNANKFMEDF